jgi:hypothetical protein
MLPPIWKVLSPMTTQFSTAVSHCVSAAPHFTYTKEIKGSHGQGIEPGPSPMRNGDKSSSTDTSMKPG